MLIENIAHMVNRKSWSFMFAKCYKMQKCSLVPEIPTYYSHHISRNHTSCSQQFQNVVIMGPLMILTNLPPAVSSYFGDC